MPEHQPKFDTSQITLENGNKLWKLAQRKQQLLMMTLADTPLQHRQEWARSYMDAQRELLDFEEELGNGLFITPWTVHEAGAPGADEEYACGDNDCDNPWCGMVQKCARCHDIVTYGFSAPGQVSEMMAQMFGSSIQGYMQKHFGENPVDEDGPTWFPVGTRIAMRSQGEGGPSRLFLVDDPEDRPDLDSKSEPLLDCESIHEDVMDTIIETDPPPIPDV